MSFQEFLVSCQFISLQWIFLNKNKIFGIGTREDSPLFIWRFFVINMKAIISLQKHAIYHGTVVCLSKVVVGCNEIIIGQCFYFEQLAGQWYKNGCIIYIFYIFVLRGLTQKLGRLLNSIL